MVSERLSPFQTANVSVGRCVDAMVELRQEEEGGTRDEGEQGSFEIYHSPLQSH